MPAPVARNAITLRQKEPHLRVPFVAAERPAKPKWDRQSNSLLLGKNCGAIGDADRWNAKFLREIPNLGRVLFRHNGWCPASSAVQFTKAGAEIPKGDNLPVCSQTPAYGHTACSALCV